jgi:integrase
VAVYDRWYRTEKQPDGSLRKARSGDHGCKGRWQVRWRDDQGRQRKQSFARKSDAGGFDKTIQAHLLAGTYVDPAAGDVTFRTYAEQWRSTRMHDPVTANRIEAMFRNHVYAAEGTPGQTARSGPAIGDVPMRALAKQVTLLQAWIKGLALHPNTVRQLIGDVAQVFTAAVDDGIIARNPIAARSVMKPSAVKTAAVPWTAGEVEAVAGQLLPRYAAMPYLGAATGMRQGELFAAALEDIDWLRKTIRVEVQLKHVGGHYYFAPVKNRKGRDVPIADPVIPVLSEHVRRHRPVKTTLPFGKPGGPPMTRTLIFVKASRAPLEKNTFNDGWRRAWRKAGLPDERARWNGCHVLRHTAASAWLSAGLNIARVAAYLGDTVEVVLASYAHFMPDDDDQARQVMNTFFEPKPGPPDTACVLVRCKNKRAGRCH